MRIRIVSFALATVLPLIGLIHGGPHVVHATALLAVFSLSGFFLIGYPVFCLMVHYNKLSVFCFVPLGAFAGMLCCFGFSFMQSGLTYVAYAICAGIGVTFTVLFWLLAIAGNKDCVLLRRETDKTRRSSCRSCFGQSKRH